MHSRAVVACYLAAAALILGALALGALGEPKRGAVALAVAFGAFALGGWLEGRAR